MELQNPLTCSEIAKLVNGELIGNPEQLIYRLDRIEFAGEGDLTFFSDKKYSKFLASTNASCILIPKSFTELPSSDRTYIAVENPYFSFFQLLKTFDTFYQKYSSYIHPTAIIGQNCQISQSAFIGPYCVIGDNCKIGDNTILIANVVVSDCVEIGDNTLIHPNVSIYYKCKVGNNCIIHSGAVIGADGFGFIENKDGSFTKIPQLGNVVIGNNVEIGANTTIDRAIVGSTVIHDGVKIDNLVQIAHNVIIGENTAMAAQVGISGSTKIGKRNRFGGQVGFVGHIEITDDVIIEAKSGVAKSITESGIYFGSPPRKKTEAFRILMATYELPKILQEFNKLKKILKDKFDIDI